MGATLANSNRAVESLPYYAKALENRRSFVRGWRNLGIAYSNINEYEPAAKAYLQALHLSPPSRHIWNYLRVVLSCMERMDLVELSTKENVVEIAKAVNVELL
jgi:peroxin-5